MWELSDYYLVTPLSVCYWTLIPTNCVYLLNICKCVRISPIKARKVWCCDIVRRGEAAARRCDGDGGTFRQHFVERRLPAAVARRGEARSCQRKFPKHRPSYLIATRLLDNVLLHITNDFLHHCHQPPDNIFLTVCTSLSPHRVVSIYNNYRSSE